MTSARATIRAAIYVRISRDAVGQGLGVKRQRADCEKLAKRLGWLVVEVYEENDTSASKGPRPVYERMMREVAAGRIDAVIVWDVDRLTRTPRELEDVIDHADRVGLKLASVGGDIDLGTEQGRMLARMKGTVARYEIEQSRRRLRAKHKELAEAGRYNGPRPFGYDVLGKGEAARLVINPAEAEVVREMVRRVLAGEALWSLTNELNARGVTTSRGGRWQTQPLRRALLRPLYAGLREHQPRDQQGKPLGKATLHEAGWAPVIDRETHERVVALLTDPKRRSNNRGTAIKYLLTSILRCGECGAGLVGTAEFSYEVKGGQRRDGTRGPSRPRIYPRQYKCMAAGCHKVQRKMTDVDEMVETVVVGMLERDGLRVLGGDPVAADHARTRINALEAKLALAADQFADDVITAEQLSRITGRLRPELEAERARLRGATPDESLAEFAGPTAPAAWKAATVERRRYILRTLAELEGMTITVEHIGSGNGKAFDPDRIRFDFKPDAQRG